MRKLASDLRSGLITVIASVMLSVVGTSLYSWRAQAVDQNRITSLEASHVDCDRDRAALRQEIARLQQQLLRETGEVKANVAAANAKLELLINALNNLNEELRSRRR